MPKQNAQKQSTQRALDLNIGTSFPERSRGKIGDLVDLPIGDGQATARLSVIGDKK